MLALIKLASPMMVCNLFALFTNLINIKIIVNSEPRYYYFFSIFLPVQFILIAITESIRICAANLSSRTNVKIKNKLNILGVKIGLMIMLTTVFILILIPFNIIYYSLSLNVFKINTDINMYMIIEYTILMCSSYIMTCVYTIFAGMAVGLSKQSVIMVLSLIGSFVSMILTFLLVGDMKLGILSLPLSLFFTNLFLILLLFPMTKTTSILFSRLSLSGKLIKHVLNTWFRYAPIFFSYLMYSVMIIVINHYLSVFGSQVVSGFGIGFRLQSIFMIPAVSLGIIVGVEINKTNSIAEIQHFSRLIQNAIMACFFIYLLFSIATYIDPAILLQYLAIQKSILQQTIIYLRTISVSFVGISICLLYCSVMDVLGKSIISLIMTISSMSFDIVIVMIMHDYSLTPYILYSIIATCNTISGMISFYLMIKLTFLQPIQNIFKDRDVTLRR